MRTFLALAAALALAAPAAAACGHTDATASVDEDMTVASIDDASQSKPDEIIEQDEEAE